MTGKINITTHRNNIKPIYGDKENQEDMDKVKSIQEDLKVFGCGGIVEEYGS
jgi:hypothetical protein